MQSYLLAPLFAVVLLALSVALAAFNALRQSRYSAAEVRSLRKLVVVLEAKAEAFEESAAAFNRLAVAREEYARVLEGHIEILRQVAA